MRRPQRAGRGGHGFRRATAVLAGTSLTLGLLVSVLAVVLPGGSRVVGVLTGGALALLCAVTGLALVHLAGRAPTGRRPTLLLLGVAFLGYGLGQLVNGLQTWLGSRPFPSPGDLVAAATVLLLLAAFAMAPTGSRGVLPTTRLVADGLMLGTATALCLWELGVPVRLHDAPGWPLLLAVVLALGLALALPVTSALRDGGLALLVVALAVVLFVSADLVTVMSRLGVAVPERLPDVGRVLHLCLPGPILLAARRWALGRRPGTDPLTPDTDTRTTALTSVAGGVLLVTVLVGSRDQPVDTGALGLCVAVVVLVLGREVLLVTTQRHLLARLTVQVMTDPLTGLRSALALRQGTALEVSGVVAVDITGLDSVNQAYGREVGDQLVHEVGGAVAEAAPRGAACYRLGGDEMAVVLPVGCPVDALEVARRVQASVACRVRVGGTDHGPRLAVGVARAGQGCALLSTLLEDAVGSMHLAQHRRSAVPVLHDATQTAVRHRRNTLEQRLPAAVAEGRITVLAQPVVDLATGVVVGVEALARWQDDVLGLVSPVEFVEAAEHTGVIDALGEHVLRTAAASAARTGLLARGLRLSVNVSPIQLRSARIVALAREVVAEHGLAHGQLTLEVTESVLLDEDGPAGAHLHELARAGVAVAIDDFGAGHASLGYLRRVPAHVLKLDRSLVVEAGTDPRARAVLQAGLELCAGLGMLSVVEGVETSDVALDMLRLGADLGQGWLWSPAVPFEDVVALLGSGTPAVAPALQ